MTDDTAFETLLQPLWDVFPRGELQIEHDATKSGLCKEPYAFRIPVASRAARNKTEWMRQLAAIELLLLASLVKPRAFVRLTRQHVRLARNYAPGSTSSSSPICWSHVSDTQVVPCRLVIDYDGYELLETTPAHFGGFGSLASQHEEPVRMYESSDLPQSPLDALTLLLTPKPRVSNCSDMEEVREKLLAMACTPSVREQWEARTIPVCIRLRGLENEELEAAVKHLSTLQQARPSGSGQSVLHQHDERENPFHAESVDLFCRDHCGEDGLPHPIVGWFKELHTVGLALRWIYFYKFPQDRKAVTNITRAITGAPSPAFVGDTIYSHGARVVTTEFTEDDVSFYSGLMHSRGVEHTSLSQIYDWHWFLYALFHASATHSIRSLEIVNVELFTEDVRRIHGLLQLPQPVYQLSGTVETPSTPKIGSFVELKEGAPVYFDRHPSNADECVAVSSTVIPLRVIDSEQDKISIILPCYGECWANASDIVLVRPDPFESDPEKQWKLKTHGITHLKFYFGEVDEEQSASMFRLLELIGEPVTSLAIDLPGLSDDEVFQLDNIWSFCPNLTELSITGAYLPSLDAFVQAYESGTCHLTSLEVVGCDVEDQDSVAVFAETLGDPSTALSRSLKHLRISLAQKYGGGEGMMDEEVAELFLSALKTNQRLSFFELQLSKNTLEMYEHEVEAQHGLYLDNGCTPLSTRARRAFMSVVKCAQTESQETSLACLDAHVLSRILYMAAEPERRAVVTTERSHFFGE